MTDASHPLQKSLQTLRALADSADGALGVRDLAAKTGFSPTTAHRTLGTLLRSGLVEREDGGGRYKLGVEAFRLGLLLAAKAPWRDLCLPFVRDLTRDTGEVSAFALVDRSRLQIQTIAKAASAHAVTVNVAEGWKSLHAGASGLATLAFMSEQDQNEALAPHRLVRETDATLMDPAELRRALQEVSARGYAITRGQRIVGAVGVGAPVFLPDDSVLGCFYVSVPEQRFDASKERKVVRCVRESAAAFTAALRA